ncbi:MAG TPA: choice-of-anchor D domain-containing protein, partial [Terriglobia bacterium]|nr:choice-of-anchor D domain-containing protein [Terriglobia bacterium]
GATLTVTDNSNSTLGSTQSASLTGAGIAPLAGLAPASLTFTKQTVGTTSSVQALTLSNTGTAVLTITGIAQSGANAADFAQTNTCGVSLPVGANCLISVTFTPSARGSRSATLTVTDNSNSGSTQTASLTGTAIAPVAGLAPASLNLSSQSVGARSTAQRLTLSNKGDATLTVANIALRGANASDFAQTNTCGTPITAGGSCAINVTFTPAASGTRSATLSITDNNNGISGSTQTVALEGSATVPLAALSPASLSFPSKNVGAASSVQQVKITNPGTETLTITSVAVGGTNSADFSETNNCGSSLEAGGNCTAMVTFKPTAIGSRAGTLRVTDNATGSPQTAALSGTGTGTSVGVTPASLTFAPQLAGGTSPPQSVSPQLAESTSSAQTVTVTNGGNADLNFSTISASGDFAVAASGTTCRTTAAVAAGKTCVVQVTFTPTAGGTRSGSLTLDDDAQGSASQTVGLTGTGEDFTLAAGQGGTTSTVSSGQAATYNLTLTPQGGFAQQVALGCAFAAPQPAGMSCSVSPPTLTPSSASAVTVTATSGTRAGMLKGPRWPTAPQPPGGWLWGLLLLTALGLVASGGPARRRRAWAGLAGFALLTTLAVGCGGGSMSMTSPPPAATPSGTYSLTLTATSGTLTQSVGLTLKVK